MGWRTPLCRVVVLWMLTGCASAVADESCLPGAMAPGVNVVPPKTAEYLERLSTHLQRELHRSKKLPRQRWAAIRRDLQTAPCRHPAPSLSELRTWSKGLSDTRSKQLFAKLAPGHSLAHSTQVSGCSSALCAAQDIWGEKAGLQLLYLLDRFGFNGSDLTAKDAIPWKAPQLDLVIQVLNDFPPGLFPLEGEELKLVHLGAADRHGTTTAYSDGDGIHVLALWDRLPVSKDPRKDRPREITLFHELCHQIGAAKSLHNWRIDDSEAWMKLSGGWTRKGPAWPETVSSTYGLENHFEDFAESMVAYRYHPEGLLKRSPEKYDFLKLTVFGGLEYRSPDQCKDRPYRTGSGH